MTPKQFIEFAKMQEGSELYTHTQRKRFFVDVSGDTLGFTPESGIRRPVQFSQIEVFCQSFKDNKKSLRRCDYPESRHGSYLVALAEAFQKATST